MSIWVKSRWQESLILYGEADPEERIVVGPSESLKVHYSKRIRVPGQPNLKNVLVVTVADFRGSWTVGADVVTRPCRPIQNYQQGLPPPPLQGLPPPPPPLQEPRQIGLFMAFAVVPAWTIILYLNRRK